VGLRQKLIDAKVDALRESSQEPVEVDTGPNSYIYLEADKTARAILETLSEANLTITQLKAPVIVESLKTPDQPVNIELETLLGEYGPLLKTLKKIAEPLGLGETIDTLEGEIKKASKSKHKKKSLDTATANKSVDDIFSGLFGEAK